LSPDAAVDCADAVPTLNIAAKIAAATWIILVSDGPETACPEENVLMQRWFPGDQPCGVASTVGEDVCSGDGCRCAHPPCDLRV
jgi:hypothetical protein